MVLFVTKNNSPGVNLRGSKRQVHYGGPLNNR